MVSVYKRAMKATAQTIIIMTGRGSLPLGGFIVPPDEVEAGKLIGGDCE